MPKTINKLLAAIAASSYLFAPVLVQAQQAADDSASWYQVEVFIFANEAYNSAKGEFWPGGQRLRYPANSVQLTKPFEESASPLFSIGDQGPTNETAGELSDNDEHAVAQTADDSIAPAVTSGPAAFELLDSDQLMLTAYAEKINKQNDFRPLFHQAWLQTMGDRDNSLSIIIRGGDQFDDHYELEGTIRLSVERYLHIQTDLWLSRFINATASEEPNWETLPKVPAPQLIDNSGPETLFVDASAPFSLASQQGNFGFFERDEYRVEKTVVMRQDRRMRSQELHYIDHPLMGVLVKIIPYEIQSAEQTPGEEPGVSAAITSE